MPLFQEPAPAVGRHLFSPLTADSAVSSATWPYCNAVRMCFKTGDCSLHIVYVVMCVASGRVAQGWLPEVCKANSTFVFDGEVLLLL